MKIKRSSVLLGFALLVLFFIIGGIYTFFSQLENRWNNPLTWTESTRISFPEHKENIKIFQEGKGENERLVSIPYCNLYKVDNETTKNTYYCSLLPLFTWSMFGFDPKETSKDQQIVFSILREDVLPSNFLGRMANDFESNSSIGSSSTPVSLTYTYQYVKPEKNLTNKYLHWSKVRENGSEPYTISVKDWSVTPIKQYNELTESERKTFADSYIKGVEKSVKSLTQLEQTTSKKTGKELLNGMADVFSYGYQSCDTKSGSVYCKPTYRHNPAEGILFYLYNKYDSVEGRKLLTAMQTKMYPFSPIGSSEVEDCRDNPETCDSYYDFTLYQYAACPYINPNPPQALVDLFAEYYTKRNTTPSNFGALDALSKTAFVQFTDLTTLDQLGEQLSDASTELDLICYGMIKNKQTTPQQWQKFRDVANQIVWRDFSVVDTKQKKYLGNEITAAELAYYGTVLQPYNYTIMPNYSLSVGAKYSGISANEYEENMNIVFVLDRALFLAYQLTTHE